MKQRAVDCFPARKSSVKWQNVEEPVSSATMPIRTFLDSGVLITAHRGERSDKKKALAILQDPDRTLLTSPFLYFEIVRKAVYFKRDSELAFYDVYFTDPSVEWYRELQAIHDLALKRSDSD